MENYENNELMVNEETNDEVVESKKGLSPAGVVGVAALVGGAIALGYKFVVKPIIKKVKAKKEANAEGVIVEAEEVVEE